MADPITSALKAAADGMEAQSMRLRTVHENMSNIDTPGYQRKLVVFEAGGRDTAVDIKEIRLDPSEGRILRDPAHPLANDDGYVTLSNVDMMVEVADAREARRTFDSNLEAFRQAREMYSGLINLLRR